MKFCFCSADSIKPRAAASHLSESFQLRMLLHLRVPKASKLSDEFIGGEVAKAHLSIMLHLHICQETTGRK